MEIQNIEFVSDKKTNNPALKRKDLWREQGGNGREEPGRRLRELKETFLTRACTGGWSCVSLDTKYVCEDINLDSHLPLPPPPGAGIRVQRSKENSPENTVWEPVLEGSSLPQNVFI